MLEQHLLIGPLDHVVGGEQPHLAALLGRGDTEGHVPLVAGLPDLRVAVVVVHLVGRAINDHTALSGAGQLIVVWFGEHLHLPITLTTYVARHSFATVLKRSGVSTSIISESLGHSSEKTTQIYLDSFENSQIDAAMQNLL